MLRTSCVLALTSMAILGIPACSSSDSAGETASGGSTGGGGGGGGGGGSGDGDGSGGGTASGTAEGAACKNLPGTGVKVCTKASAACASADAGCLLLVVHNTDGPFAWVDAGRGPLVVARSYGPSDGSDVKDWVAEAAVVLRADYPGIDPKRVFFLGWSAGAGAAYRGICHASKGNGISQYGNNGELYAGMVTLGGCPSCSASWSPAGTFHTLAINGADDQFGGNGCEEHLAEMAKDNGCGQAGWQNVGADDPLMPGRGTGSDAAQKLDYGTCAGGAVAGYRFKAEGHVLSFKKSFDPKVSALEMAWVFLEDKRK